MHNVQERRKYERREKLYMAGVRVKQSEGRKRGSTGWDSVTLHNLSAGGTFFTYKKDLGIGTLVDLKIDVPESMLTINCVGKVIRIEELQLASKFRIEIKFTDIGEQEKELISKSVEGALE